MNFLFKRKDEAPFSVSFGQLFWAPDVSNFRIDPSVPPSPAPLFHFSLGQFTWFPRSLAYSLACSRFVFLMVAVCDCC